MRKTVKKLFAVALTSAMALMMLAGCGNIAGSASGGKKILLSMNDDQDTFRKLLIDGLLYIVRDGKVYDARGARVE